MKRFWNELLSCSWMSMRRWDEDAIMHVNCRLSVWASVSNLAIYSFQAVPMWAGACQWQECYTGWSVFASVLYCICTRVLLYFYSYCTVLVLVFYCIFTRIVLYLYSCSTVFVYAAGWSVFDCGSALAATWEFPLLPLHGLLFRLVGPDFGPDSDFFKLDSYYPQTEI